MKTQLIERCYNALTYSVAESYKEDTRKLLREALNDAVAADEHIAASHWHAADLDGWYVIRDAKLKVLLEVPKELPREEKVKILMLAESAPELLKQLETVLNCIEAKGECLGDMAAMRKIIAKAKGMV